MTFYQDIEFQMNKKGGDVLGDTFDEGDDDEEEGEEFLLENPFGDSDDD